ncbi:MAG: hypothetical protein B6I31_04545, partial [Desulfobacteraceae bacterium 4572_19]
IEKKIVADNYQGQIGTIIKTKVPFNMELSEDLYGKINPDIKDSNNNNDDDDDKNTDSKHDDKNTDSKLSDLFEKWVRLLFIEKSFMELRKRL